MTSVSTEFDRSVLFAKNNIGILVLCLGFDLFEGWLDDDDADFVKFVMIDMLVSARGLWTNLPCLIVNCFWVVTKLLMSDVCLAWSL